MNSQHLNERQVQVMRILESREGGISCLSLAGEIGLSVHWMAAVLHQLRDMGLARVTRPGRGALWSTPERAADLYLAERTAAALRKRSDGPDYPPGFEQRWMPAGSYVMHIPPAPSSVFNLRA